MRFEQVQDNFLAISFTEKEEIDAIRLSYYEEAVNVSRAGQIIPHPILSHIKIFEAASINQRITIASGNIAKEVASILLNCNRNTATELVNIANLVRPVRKAYEQIVLRAKLGEVAGKMATLLSNEVDVVNFSGDIERLGSGEIEFG